MKIKTVVGCAFLFAFFSAAAEERSPIDLVLALDTSAGLYASRATLSEYLVGPLLAEHLRPGDTFHLLSFSDELRPELSRRIEGAEDVETIIARLLITYPLYPYTDYIGALDSLFVYVSTLQEMRPKTVLIVSDGEHAPPPASPHSRIDPTAAKGRIASLMDRFRNAGWKVDFINVPLDESRQRQLSRWKERDARQAVVAQKPASAVAGPGEPAAARSPDSQPAETGRVAGAPIADARPRTDDVAESGKGQAARPVDSPTAAPSEKAAPAIPSEPVASKPEESPVPASVLPVPTDSSVADVGVDGAAANQAAEQALTPKTDSRPSNIPTPVAPGKLAEEEKRPSLVGKAISGALGAIGGAMSAIFAAAAPYLLISLLVLIAVVAVLLLAKFLRGAYSRPNRYASRASGKRAEDRTVVRTAATSAPLKTPASSATPAPSVRASEAATAREVLAPIRQPAAADSRPLLVAPVKESKTLATPQSRQFQGPATGLAISGNSADRSYSGLPLKISRTREPKHKESLIPVTGQRTLRKAEARIMLSLWVRDQNRNIGKRNVHLMKAGTTLSLGGGRSDFLIFLVSVPHRIADVHFDGETCALIPRRAGYFPDNGTDAIEDCLEKTIRIVSQKGFELYIRLEKFEDPLLKLNSFLHSIDAVGIY